MNALDSPVEPLALNYLSYGFFTAVNKMLAAWVAAVTAAFSFWMIGPSSHPRPEQRGRTKDAAASTSLLDRGLEELVVADEEPAELVSTQGGTNCISSLETENSTKGKFVLYYRNDDFREGGVEDDDGVAAEGEKFRRWSDMDWEGKMKIRMGDMGWYRCQDLAAFNGSVVRLWDGRSRVCAIDGRGDLS